MPYNEFLASVVAGYGQDVLQLFVQLANSRSQEEVE
jgi:hypothetical protein